MQPLSPSADRREIGVLYGFRALMVLLVANYHIWQQSWLGQYVNVLGVHWSFDYITRSSYLFVDGMMLLSGFLLYLPYARARLENAPRPSARAFYRKRFARIVPSYLAVIAAGLLFIALPQGLYASPARMAQDLAMHLTFTHVFSPYTYFSTPLGGALWTVAVEMQFYLIFPLLARSKRLWPTVLAMAACGLAYRALVSSCVKDTAMWINQLPAFLDVFALGMLGAAGYTRLRARVDRLGRGAAAAVAAGAVCAFALGLWALSAILRAQSAVGVIGHAELRLGQLRARLPFALAMLALMLSAAFLPRALAWLLSNRLMRFLSAISFNLYMVHQQLAVQMRQAWFTSALHADPRQQSAYTLLCFAVALVVATLTTYLVEKPCAGLLNHPHQHMRKKDAHERSEA